MSRGLGDVYKRQVGAPPGGSYPDPDIQEGIGTTITVARWTKIEWSDTDVGGGE